ncbi:hypothetical protein AB1K70_06845 [Bremerella sp. JC770]|uniref:tetratricopeptide repeat protein n=1 Tax=Bremerella sp. JC770 TaxID=3232137 RepID=UPI00345858C6
MRITKQILLATGLLLAFSSASTAKEPFDEFFNGLLQRGYHEQAIWYIESMADNPGLSDDVKKTLDYRKAIAQIEAARRSANLDTREELLVAAGDNLGKFLKANPQSDRVIDATIQRGNVLSDQARLAEARARREEKPADKKPFLDMANKRYGEARKVFEDANKQIREALTGLPKVLDPSKDASKIAFRDEMRASYIQTQLLASNCLFEMAKTLPEDNPDRKKQLAQAAKEFGETYSKYKSRLAGLYARLYEAQAQQALGKTKEAIAIYVDDLMLLGDQPEQFRQVKLKAAIGLAEIWMKQDEQAKVLKDIAPWLADQQLRANQERDEDWLNIKLIVAKAYKKDADGRDNKDKQRGENRREALKLAVDVAKYPSEFQKEALQIRTDLQGEDAVAQDESEAKTFQEAVTAGRDLITEANTQSFAVRKMQADLKATKDKATKEQLTSQIEADQKVVQEAFSKAESKFQQALQLADRDTSSDEVNGVQYFLSFLGFQDGDYWQTYARASFVAQRYPNSPSAKPCSKMALACALRLFEEAPADNRAFELGLVQNTTDFMVKTWPDSEEAGQALLALIGFQLQQASSKELSWDQQKAMLEAAEKSVAKIADGTAAKADAQLKVGQTYWNLFLRGNALRREAKDNPDAMGVPTEQQLTAIKDKTQSILAAGVDSYQGDDPDYSYVLGALSLIQVYTDIGEPEKAVQLLEKKNVGLMNLVEAKNPAASRPGVDQLIYKAAVRAYISALPNTTDASKTEALMANAEKAMAQLKSLVGGDAEGQKQLVAIYISLANDLKTQLDNANPASKVALAGAFEKFLNRVAESSNEPNVLNWVGETFYNLGQSFSEDPSFNGDTKSFYNKAIAAYQQILNRPQGSALNPALVQQVRVRIAMAQREIGEYEQAIATFTEVLKEKNMMVNVQVEAAKTYYMWGLNGGDSKTFYQSLMGAEPNPENKQNLIWGWGRLQSILARYAQAGADPSPFKETFFECRYYLAACRYQFALAQSSNDKKDQYLAAAAKDISSTQSFDPTLGGDEWFQKFDTLMRKIQKDLTGEAKGLDKPTT